MTEPRMVCSYQYINRSYQEVCALLLREPLDVLQRATTSASKRTKSLATSLRVTFSALEISVDVRLFVRHIREDSGPRWLFADAASRADLGSHDQPRALSVDAGGALGGRAVGDRNANRVPRCVLDPDGPARRCDRRRGGAPSRRGGRSPLSDRSGRANSK